MAFDSCTIEATGCEYRIVPKYVEYWVTPPFAEAMVEPIRPGFERDRETWGDAYRKPYAYNIVANEVLPPFIRKDSRRNRPNCPTERSAST